MDALKVAHTSGGFFTVDRRSWKILCGLDDIKMVASYLTICAGTGRGNKVSLWSAEAIHTYTGLAWPRAKDAISKLIAGDFVCVTESSRTRPAYEIQPFDVVLDAARRRMSHCEQYAMNAIRRNSRLAKSTRQDAERLVMRGLMWQNGTTFFTDPPTHEAGANLIWLPNTLVTGTDKGEPSPVKRLRQCWNLDALRLLVDLYHAQALASDGGISRKVIRRQYQRKRYGEYGRNVVWGFTKEEACASPAQLCLEYFRQRNHVLPSNKIGIWEVLMALLNLGLLVEVPHLVESSQADCEILHGCGWDGSGEPLEQTMAKAADAAGRRMLAEPFTNRAINQSEVLVPVSATLPEAQLVGIYRLRYRPHTAATSAWMRELQEVATIWINAYGELAPHGDWSRERTGSLQ
jgi:hypothetical protein